MDTTLQLIDRERFKAAGGFDAHRLIDVFPALDEGPSAVAVSAEVEAVHLGWDEEEDYPGYVARKDGRHGLPSYVYGSVLRRASGLFERAFFERCHKNRDPEFVARVQAGLLASLGPAWVLDVGSGQGHLVRALAAQGIRASGVDVSDYCQRTALVPSRFVRARAEEIPFADSSFDVVFASELFEYLDDRAVDAVLAEMARVSSRYVAITLHDEHYKDANDRRLSRDPSWWRATCARATGFDFLPRESESLAANLPVLWDVWIGKRRRPRETRRLVFCLFERMGDVVAGAPVFDLLRRRFPDREVAWAVLLPYAPLARAAGAKSVIEIDPGSSPHHVVISGFLRDPAVAETHELALAQVFPGDHHLWERLGVPLMDYMAAKLGLGPLEDRQPHLSVPPLTRAQVDVFLEEEGLAERVLVALAPDSVTSHPWPRSAFLDLVLRHPYARFLQVGGVADPLLEAEEMVDLRGRDLLFVLDLVARCELFLGNDSGPAWLAAATRTPMLVLMDPERTARYPVGFRRLGLAKEVVEEPITRTAGEIDRVFIEAIFGSGRPAKGLESTACLCGERVSRFFGAKNGFAMRSCVRCGLLRVEPRPVLEFLENNLYSKKYWFETQREVSGHPTIVERVSEYDERAPRLLAGLRRFVSSGRLLDVGCSHGAFVKRACEAGFEAEGTEMDEWVVQFARDLFEIEVTRGTLEEIAFPSASFDAVTLYDVFEHLPDPRGTLVELARILRPGGVLLIQTPCFSGQDISWVEFRPEQHLYIFSEALIVGLLREHGFEVVDAWIGETPEEITIVARRGRTS